MSEAAARVRRLPDWLWIPVFLLIGLSPIPLLALAVLWTMASSGPIVEETRYPSPAGDLTLIEHVEGGGGAAGWVLTTLFIADAKGARHEVANLRHTDPFSVRWPSGDRVQVCSPCADVDSWSSSVVLGAAPRARTVHVQRQCWEPVARPSGETVE